MRQHTHWTGCPEAGSQLAPAASIRGSETMAACPWAPGAAGGPPSATRSAPAIASDAFVAGASAAGIGVSTSATADGTLGLERPAAIISCFTTMLQFRGGAQAEADEADVPSMVSASKSTAAAAVAIFEVKVMHWTLESTRRSNATAREHKTTPLGSLRSAMPRGGSGAEHRPGYGSGPLAWRSNPRHKSERRRTEPKAAARAFCKGCQALAKLGKNARRGSPGLPF